MKAHLKKEDWMSGTKDKKKKMPDEIFETETTKDDIIEVNT